MNALERLLCNKFGDDDLPETIIANGWAPPGKRTAITELLAEHADTEWEDDHNGHCECGKWLEYEYYDLPHHQSLLLDDSGLLTPGTGWDDE